MTFEPTQTFIIMSVVALGTAITRFLPFILFKSVKENSSYIDYLGEVLP